MSSRYFLVLSCLAAGIAAAQEPAAPVASKVEGTVVNSASGEPIRKANVLLQPYNGADRAQNATARPPANQRGWSYAVESDGSGRFTVDNLSPGEYTVTAEHQNFVMQPTGATGAPPPRVQVDPGAQVKNFIVRLIPLGVITGRVVDRDGDPVRGANVDAMIYGYQNGQRLLHTVAQVQTGDKGEYRLYGLRPGNTYVRATPRQSQGSRFGPALAVRDTRPQPALGPTFFPNAAEVSGASPIPLAAGQQVAGMDIRLSNASTFAIRIKLPVEHSDHEVNYSVEVMARNSPDQFMGRQSRRTPEGWEFHGLTPGAYSVVAIVREGAKRLFARQDVEIVNADVNDVTLTFAPGADLAGTVRIEGTPSRPLGPQRVSLQPEVRMPIGVPNAEAGADGKFVLHDVASTVYQLLGGPGPGGYWKSIRLGDREVPDRRLDLTQNSGPLQIVVGTDVGRLDGTVKNAKGDPVVRARVTTVPAGAHAGRQDWSRFAFSDEKGEFHIINIPPGDYKVFAWEDVQAGAPQDPVFRKPFESRGVAVKIAPNATEKADVAVISKEDVANPPRVEQ